jgi:hypothetical protein
MNKAFILLVTLMGYLFVADDSQAATITQDLGVIQQGTHFQATVNYYPDPWFDHTYSFTVPKNEGTGVAAINARFAGSTGIKFTLVEIWDGVKNWALTAVNPANDSSYFYGHFQGLECISCILNVQGRITAPHSATYNGNWTIIEPAAVPVPGSIWLFGSALVGLLSINRRGKR